MTKPQLTVMVVDDSEITREVVREILEEGGYHVVTLDSPIGLSRAISAEVPDLVLIDVQMPALRGDQAVQVVRNHKIGACPLVLHSDRPVEELRDLATRSGATGFIRKTDDPAQLLAEIRRFIRL